MTMLLNQATCDCKEQDYREPSGKWMGWRPFCVKSIQKESDSITSLYLYPVDQKPIPMAKAGQFICVEVEIPNVGPRRRNYSLSSAPNEEYFRISVKEVKDGLVSPYLTSKAKEGEIFEVSGPYGEFFFHSDQRPVALISGGCGIAPIMSLVEEMIQQGYKSKIQYIHATQTPESEAFRDKIRKLAEEGRLSADIFYSRTEILPSDLKNLHYHSGYLSSAFLTENIPKDADCYICGPQGIMFATIKTLSKMGIPHEQLFYELNACI